MIHRAPIPRIPRKRGFMLLEVVLAVGIFAAAATGFVIALNQMAATAEMAQREMRVTRILHSALHEALSIPQLEEDEYTTEVIETGMEIKTRIEIIDDLENQDGQLLQEMFRIEITARWYESSGWRERSVEALRYGRMYQPP
jgi:hypothetical protein